MPLKYNVNFEGDVSYVTRGNHGDCRSARDRVDSLFQLSSEKRWAVSAVYSLQRGGNMAVVKRRSN